jgi:triacylglycerol esterase/lipase EstA (alpha/beta hydrolase family)
MAAQLFSYLLFMLCVFLLPAAQANDYQVNKYPIILVHGFAGWSRTELGGFKYWGGLHGDYQERLKSEGFEVYTASIGPFSSNWDRACELYAAIKGGRVDYGENHSNRHGHVRFGKSYPGLYPQWGNVVNGQVQKVHLVGHSMGGQTIRMLAQLLAHGTKGAPDQEDPLSHPLFMGGQDDWIHSITTIATPNQGTLLADGFAQIGDTIESATAAFFGLIGSFGKNANNFYDPKLDQWGIKPRQEGESMNKYIKRIFASPMFKPGFKDICVYSLSTVGAKEENEWVTTLPNIFYYSFSNKDTFKSKNVLWKDVQMPNPLSMLLPLQPLGLFLGSRFGPDEVGVQEEWQPNDGVVNTASMKSDGIGAAVEFDSRSLAGRWHHVALLDNMDHEAVVGVKLKRDPYDLYAAHANLLQSLPIGSGKSNNRLLRSQEALVHEAPSHVTERMQTAIESINAEQDINEVRILCETTEHVPTRRLCEMHQLVVNVSA